MLKNSKKVDFPSDHQITAKFRCFHKKKKKKKKETKTNNREPEIKTPCNE